MTPLLLPGDAPTELRKLAAASVQACITSPPYLGMRKYNAGPGEIGQEPTWGGPGGHLEALLGVLDEVWRVLRPDGTLWINYGDKFVSGGHKNPRAMRTDVDVGGWGSGTRAQVMDSGDAGLGLPKKCLMGLPERLALAMIDGVEGPEGPHKRWVWHAKPPWVKRNGMPDSAPGRPGFNLEHLMMFSKKGFPYYDAEAVRLAYAPATVARADGSRVTSSNPETMPGFDRTLSHPGRSRRMGDAWLESVRAIVGCEHQAAPRFTEANQSWDRDSKEAEVPGARSKQHRAGRDKRAEAGRRDGGFDDRYDNAHPERSLRDHQAAPATGGLVLAPDNGMPLGLFESTQGFRAADYETTPGEFGGVDHFATFPEHLVEPLILSSTSAKGCCPACGAPWARVVEVVSKGRHNAVEDSGGVEVLRNLSHDYEMPKTTGWRPTCECSAPGFTTMAATPIPCRVLDPFSGAGTTLLVADRLGRQAIGIELNPVYVKIARARLAQDPEARHARLERAQGSLVEAEL